MIGEAVRSRPASGRDPVGCAAAALLLPRSTAEVAAALRICHGAGVPVVPRAGMTGLVGGTVAGPHEIALSLERLTGIGAVDAAGATLTAGAGATIEAVQRHTAESGFLFALDLGSRGSATVGGAIATNAGGNKVIRYGMMRDLVLGLEAVLADGTVVSSMNALLKNNTGLDLKQLFIGTEGTLGVVTRAVLRLYPLPRARHTALAALPDFAAMAGFLRAMREESNGALSSFEAMWPSYYALATRPAGRLHPPLPHGAAFYALVEWEGADAEGDAQRFGTALARALEAGLIADAVLARSEAERTTLWAIRDDVTEHLRPLAPRFSFDVSLPIPSMPEYVDTLTRVVAARWPGAAVVAFGHLGDGNLHVIVSAGRTDVRAAVEELVYRPLAALGGAVSAEHGIGLDRKAWLALSRSAEERRAMALVKRALDPANILNPGKILDSLS
ncbi:FAD-binding oxidoreductase [Azospirillum sp. TSO22-1]|uniref:FAD-binding oxidoreductase n=1 Tax=Azospirillum sp. TSO22-1 TaxID=716789 RepID=UPI0018EE971A|nr:FAD-binding oxidoreductase [Azospirillum sp. TSO22-1]